jgi:hypothetical protein
VCFYILDILRHSAWFVPSGLKKPAKLYGQRGPGYGDGRLPPITADLQTPDAALRPQVAADQKGMQSPGSQPDT